MSGKGRMVVKGTPRERTHLVQLKINETLWGHLTAVCDAWGMSEAEVCRWLIIQHFLPQPGGTDEGSN